MACQPAVKDSDALSLSDLSPVISFAHGTKTDEAVSYAADVEVYSSNDRSVEPPSLLRTYRLAVKIIDDRLHCRIDMPGSSFPDGKARAMLSDGVAMRVVDPETMKTESSFDMMADEVMSRIAGIAPNARTLEGFVGKTDLPAVMDYFRTMAFDITNEGGGQGLAVHVPASALRSFSRPGYKYTKAKFLYDAELSAYAGADVEVACDDDLTLKVSNRPVYEDFNGTLVKVGEITETYYDLPGMIDLDGTTVPQVNNAADLPVLSEAELAALQAEGGTLTQSELILGDPANPDYTVTEISVYQDIEVNTLDDAVFRIAD